jgi:uncharacterized protein DUF4232
MNTALRWGITVAAAVAAVGATAFAVTALRADHGGTTARGTAGGGTTGGAAAAPATRAPTPASSTATPRSSAAAHSGCTAGQFVATVAGQAAAGTQHTLVVVLWNTSASGCGLSGYPGVTVQARPAAGGPPAALTVAVHHGGVTGRTDPGPRPIAIGPHGSVSFALAMTDAGGGIRYQITELRLSLPGDPAPVRAPVDLTIGTAAGAPVPVAITAFVDGTQGP